jgi:hypothetical protein
MVELRELIKHSALKALSLAKLTSTEYSIILYLMNCIASGFSKIVLTQKELTNLIDLSEPLVKESLLSLEEKNIIKIRYVENANPRIEEHSFVLGLEMDIRKWKVQSSKYQTVVEAIVYPLSRKNSSHLESIHSAEIDKEDKIEKVVSTFCKGRTLLEKKKQETRKAASDLIEMYPLEGIVLILEHFSRRIKSLGFLVSSWQHFEELYEQETQQVSFTQAKFKHLEKERILKQNIKKILENSNSLSKDEIEVLNIIANHKHPRRQLFWAYRVKHKYKGLSDFFSENSHLMLAVTTSGHVLKKK